MSTQSGDKMIWYEAMETEGDGRDLAVAVNRVVRLSKEFGTDNTLIHLDTGEVLRSADSMSVLVARINIASREAAPADR